MCGVRCATRYRARAATLDCSSALSSSSSEESPPCADDRLIAVLLKARPFRGLVFLWMPVAKAGTEALVEYCAACGG